MEKGQGAGSGHRRLRRVIQFTLAIVVSLVALWLAGRGADLEDIQHTLSKSSILVIGAFGVGQLLIHGFRIVRWGIYLRALEPSLSGRAIFAASNLGTAATFFLPFRIGEFVRPVMINRSGVPFGGAVASIVVERIADGLVSVAMFFVFFSFVPENSSLPDELTQLSTGAAVAFGGALIFLVAAAFAREPVLGLTGSLLRRISPVFAERVVGLISTFLEGLAALGNLWRACAYIALTVAYWVGNGLLTWMLAASYQPDLPVVSGLFTISVLVFAVMIPAAPAFAGTFQLGFKLGFGAFGLDASSTVVISVVAHLMQLVMMASLVGLGLMAAEPGQTVSLAKTHPSSKEEPRA